ncbi:MAG: hypothetical protein AAGH15_10245, partial [Myxococcota bacterium]
ALTSVGVAEDNILVLDSIEAFESKWASGLRDGYFKGAGEPTYRKTLDGGGALVAFLVNYGMAWRPLEALAEAGGTPHGNFTTYRQELLTGWLGPLAIPYRPTSDLQDRRWTDIFTQAVFEPTDKKWTNLFDPVNKLWTNIFTPIDKLWTGPGHIGGRDRPKD